MDSREFLETARRFARGPTEGDWRSAVSRSYYFIFHFLREFCRSQGLDIGPDAQAHTNLYYGLNNCGDAAVRAVAYRLNTLRRDRTNADYDLTQTVTQSEGQAAVDEADAMVADFQAILAKTPAAIIVGGAKRHLQLIGRIP